MRTILSALYSLPLSLKYLVVLVVIVFLMGIYDEEEEKSKML
ncbi:MAG: hypothetical protein WBE61_06080 [Nitrososphaeraceae archaeon]